MIYKKIGAVRSRSDPHEVRVLGCLIEKEATTPDVYPLTLNSLRHASQPVDEPGPRVTVRRPGDRAGADLAPRARLDPHRPQHVEPGDQVPSRATRCWRSTPARRRCCRSSCCAGADGGRAQGRTERQHRFDSIDEVSAVLAALAGRTIRSSAGSNANPDRRTPAGCICWRRSTPRRSPRAVLTCGRRRRSGNEPPSPRPVRGGDRRVYDLLETAMWDTFGLQMLDVLGRRRSRRRADHRRREWDRDRAGLPPRRRSPARGWSRRAVEGDAGRAAHAPVRVHRAPRADDGDPHHLRRGAAARALLGNGAVGADRSPVRRRADAAVVVRRRATRSGARRW